MPFYPDYDIAEVSARLKERFLIENYKPIHYGTNPKTNPKYDPEDAKEEAFLWASGQWDEDGYWDVDFIDIELSRLKKIIKGEERATYEELIKIAKDDGETVAQLLFGCEGLIQFSDTFDVLREEIFDFIRDMDSSQIIRLSDYLDQMEPCNFTPDSPPGYHAYITARNQYIQDKYGR